MSDWTNVIDIRKKLERRWEKGEFLFARLKNETLVRRIPLKKPGSNDWVERYDTTKTWIDGLVAGGKKHSFEIEFREIDHRQRGLNRFPQAVVFDSDESLFKFIGKLGSVHRFDVLSELILGVFPELRPWMEKRSLVALKNDKNWPRLLAVLSFLKQNLRPGIYVRQLEIAGVDTKFIEKHKKLLSELLDIVLPEDAISWEATGVKKFEQRYGFTSKPLQVRFRVLDEDHYISGLSDLQLPADEFNKLHLDIDTVFITENEINGLAFPPAKRAIIIFGLGFGLDRLAEINWLKSRDIHYWGDIDTHGFVMLDQLRSYFPKASSFLMDRQTLLEHRPQWGVEERPTNRSLHRLLPEEQEVYHLLVRDEFTARLRLEQEKISYRYVKRQLFG
ncbi:hypothetical protein JWJ90_12070 [Desulfobulbus rhabdoformis]|uniref:Wadjet anti-phage system protein JetD domain-containing protein n=1 Tax=Desulfobulbus rhabdoformis TaxID=34032 RepID=UPI001965D402|nr:Wadjet anti-phage system protein JetD domain-containing protein [Desulfobulbus rhabdoformis]MBM9615016.1 hypothetical protein [Desulfobulbus rhabdoformis]